MTEERKLYLTNTWVLSLFIYYLLVFIAGICLSIIALLPDLAGIEKSDITKVALIGSIGMACIGSSIFYIRKLYKLCFKEHVTIEKDTYLKRVGTIVYFLARPIFSLGFSILVVIGLQSGFMLTSNKPLDLNNGFVYITMFASFFVGFLSGRFIKQLESSGEKIIKKVSN